MKSVVFVCDDSYAVPTIVAITSLLKNAKTPIDRIYICHPGLSETNVRLFQEFSNPPWSVNVVLIEHSITHFDSLHLKHDSQIGAGSNVALLKFDLCDLIPEDVVLYLDGDILVQKDISPIFSTDISRYLAGVVIDSGKLYSHGGLREKLPKYFNSGVMLLNLKRIREENFRQKLIECKKSLNNEKLVDQDAFNLVFRGQVTILPVVYNALVTNLRNSASKFRISTFNSFYKTSFSCLYDFEENATIMHFASKLKPWKYNDVPFAGIWNAYYKQSPCKLMKLNRENYYQSSFKYKEIPIILATDENYLLQTLVTIVSVMENSSKECTYHFRILTKSAFTQSGNAHIRAITSKYRNCSIETVEMGDAFSDVKLNIPHITSPTFYRLLSASLFPEFSRVIYLDSDVIVESDLKLFFNQNISEYYVAGVKAPSYHAAINGNKKYCQENHLPAIDQYINAGVILLNTENIRQDGVEAKFIELARHGLRSQDQDVINSVCYGRIKHLEYQYNCMAAKYEDGSILRKVFTRSQINAANNLPKIIHYAAESKPWKNLDCALADRWWKYATLTPFYEEIALGNLSDMIFAAKTRKWMQVSRKQISRKQIVKRNSLEKAKAVIRNTSFYPIARYIWHLFR